MRKAFTPERARDVRQLFERVVGLSTGERASVLAVAGLSDATLRQQVEALLVADQRAGAMLDAWGVQPTERVTLTRWDRLRTLLIHLLTLPEPQRGAALDELYAGEASARTHMADLLADLQAAPGVLGDGATPDVHPGTTDTGVSPTPPPQPGDPLIGLTISHYQIEQRLGQGGMGVVYKARDTSLDRTVALKFLPPALGLDQAAEARFIHEAKAASALDHPNIAVVHEINRTDDGRLYIVMAYYGGETLRQRMASGPLPFEDALDIALQMASGLQRAHDKGIVHRDIKPENVMFTDDGQVKIVDFGLAKVEDVTLTRTGTSMGTLAYMSPEQAYGGPIDHRVDLWALGVVVFEMLAGERPFKATYEAAALYAITNQEPEAVQALRPDTSDALQAVVRTLLQKDPDQRYQAAADVIHDLKAVQADAAVDPALLTRVAPLGTPAVGSVEPQEASAPTLLASRRMVAIGLGLGGLALLAMVLTFWILGQQSAPTVDLVALQADQRRQEARTLEQRGLDYATQGQLALAQVELERAIDADPSYSTAWSTLAAIAIRQQDYPAALAHSRQALSLDTTNTAAYYNLAYALEETGAYDEALDAYREAVAINPAFAEAYSALGNRLVALGHPEEALQVMQDGVMQASASENLFLIHKNMGKAHMALQVYDKAIAALEQARRLQPNWPETLALLAESYDASGQPEQARPLWERYLQLEADPARRQAAQARLNPLP